MTRRNLIRAAILAPLCSSFLSAANAKLYLKDGTYQIAREYKVEGDRVRYYSTERGDWEELPLELVDLKKTESEVKEREESRREETKTLAEEDKAERDARKEIERIPQDTGVYLIAGETLQPLKAAETKVVNNKGRHLLKMASPIPLITDKSWLEVDGLHSGTVVKDPRPEFYFRLASEERFGLVRMSEHKGNRVVEKLTIMPVVKEVVEEPELIDTFRRQVGKICIKSGRKSPLPAGEYALVEYTDGKVNMQVWDFGFAPVSK